MNNHGFPCSRFSFVSICLAATMVMPTIAARAAGIDSVYTELSTPSCLPLPELETGGGGLRCQGPADYELLAHDEDARVSITLVAPDGEVHGLDYWHVVTRFFSALGPRAEWRMKSFGGQQKPIALIVRVNAYEDVENPRKVTSYLVVAKITDTEVCVTDKVRPSADQNVRARQAADASARHTCLTTDNDPAQPLKHE